METVLAFAVAVSLMVFPLVAWKLDQVRSLPSPEELDAARALKALGFEQAVGDVFVSAYDPHIQVFLGPRRSTALIRTSSAPFGEFPKEEDAEFSPDGILVHFQTGFEQVEPALLRAKALLQETEEAGRWRVAAEGRGLRFRMVAGLRQIDGITRDGVEVSVRQHGSAADVSVDIPAGPWARQGRGSSGNPVLDLLIDSHGIPDSACEGVLDVVHGRRGRLEEGRLLVRWTGDMEACLDTVLSIARALRQ